MEWIGQLCTSVYRFILRVRIASCHRKLSLLRYYRQYTDSIWTNFDNLLKLAIVKADIPLNYTQKFIYYIIENRVRVAYKLQSENSV
jgi:hypothetical protein